MKFNSSKEEQQALYTLVAQRDWASPCREFHQPFLACSTSDLKRTISELAFPRFLRKTDDGDNGLVQSRGQFGPVQHATEEHTI
jgi:hypothetical protein